VIAEFGKGAPDEKWIPGIASQHGCMVTQDLKFSTLYANARTVLDLILLNLQRQPRSHLPRQVSEKNEEGGPALKLDGEKVFSPGMAGKGAKKEERREQQREQRKIAAS